MDKKSKEKIIECINYAEEQHKSSGGEILDNFSDDEFEKLENLIKNL